MSVISQFAGGGVKSVQSGVASAAGTITINSVSTTKSVVLSISKGSAGTVAARGNIASTGTIGGQVGNGNWNQIGINSGGYQNAGWPIMNGTVSTSGTLSGGSTDLTTKQYSARLTNATTLTVDGPCEWQVIEYY